MKSLAPPLSRSPPPPPPPPPPPVELEEAELPAELCELLAVLWDAPLEEETVLEEEVRGENRLVAPRKLERLLELPEEEAPPEETEAVLEEFDRVEPDEEEPEAPPPPPPPPPMFTVTITAPPAAWMFTPPRPPRSCGAMRLTYFSAVVVPASLRVF